MTVPLSHLVLPVARGVGSDVVEAPAPGAGTTSPRRAGGSPPVEPDLAEMMGRFYADVDAEVAAHSPVCINRGACCKFKAFGHRLYVTDLELRYFVTGMAERWASPSGDGGCPFQRDGVCTARAHRPLGCRVYFCDPASRDWQGPLYERFLTRLKAMGDRLGIRYRYREWLSALEGAIDPRGAGRIR